MPPSISMVILEPSLAQPFLDCGQNERDIVYAVVSLPGDDLDPEI